MGHVVYQTGAGLPPFIRYVINRPHAYWWEQYGLPFLSKRNWYVIKPSHFTYTTSYGFDSSINCCLPGSQVCDLDYCLQNAAVVAEYHDEPVYNSIFDPSSKLTVIDDLLAFLSIYSGAYCQYLWKEWRSSVDNWSASLALQLYNENNIGLWAAPLEKAIYYFEKALSTRPTINETRFRLSMQWYFSALREFEIGRPLVEASLNWVCLEVQANFLRFPGKNLYKVKSLLSSQQFDPIPLLGSFYKLRNDGFHSGQLSKLNEADAQAARTAGRALVRASILVLLGMDHADFNKKFSDLYT